MHALEGFMDGVQVYLGSFCDIPEAVILGKLPLAQVLPEAACLLPLRHPHLGPDRGQTGTLAATTLTQSSCNTSHHAM